MHKRFEQKGANETKGESVAYGGESTRSMMRRSAFRRGKTSRGGPTETVPLILTGKGTRSNVQNELAPGKQDGVRRTEEEDEREVGRVWTGAILFAEPWDHVMLALVVFAGLFRVVVLIASAAIASPSANYPRDLLFMYGMDVV